MTKTRPNQSQEAILAEIARPYPADLQERHVAETAAYFDVREAAGLPRYNGFQKDSAYWALEERHRKEWVAATADYKPTPNVNDEGDAVVDAVKAERTCRNCPNPIPPTGKRGRQPVLCPSCKDAAPVAAPRAENHCKTCQAVIPPTGRKGRQPSLCEAHRGVQTPQERPENHCVGCSTVIPPTGKRGRQPSVCVACRAAGVKGVWAGGERKPRGTSIIVGKPTKAQKAGRGTGVSVAERIAAKAAGLSA